MQTSQSFARATLIAPSDRRLTWSQCSFFSFDKVIVYHLVALIVRASNSGLGTEELSQETQGTKRSSHFVPLSSQLPDLAPSDQPNSINDIACHMGPSTTTKVEPPPP